MVQIPWLGCHWFYVPLFYFISLTKNRQESQPKLKPSVTYPRMDDLDIACEAKLLKIRLGINFLFNTGTENGWWQEVSQPW